jgi:predicted HD phosphohydrolase
MPDYPRNIVHLEELVGALSSEERERFARVFQVNTTIGELRAPPSMHEWIQKYFGTVEAVQRQRIVKVTNLITLEGALFNELRASRPMEARDSGDLQQTIMSNAGDPFCQPLEGTPEDVFGRVKGEHCITASNVAKYDGFHGLVVFNEHNPLRFSAEEVADYIDTALSWARQAHCVDKEARYFFLMWNCLWRSGASILHGHMQMTLGRGIHYARIEHLRRAALLYQIGHGVSYFDDLYAIHQSLGLATEHRGVRILAYLTPIKEKEVILMSRYLDEDLKHAVYKALDCFVNKLRVTSFNLALCMRPIDSVPEDWQGFPMVVRIVDRGDPNNRTADFAAMELYASSVVTSDPFQVAEALCDSFQPSGSSGR